MKKISVFLFSLAVCLSLCACSSGAPEVSSSDDSAPPSEPVLSESPPSDTSNPLLLNDFQVIGLQSGSGEDIGRRGYLYVSRQSLPELSSPDFSEMLSEFMDQRISGTDYNYTIVDFGDGMGLHIIGDMSVVFYSELDGDMAGASYGCFVRDSAEEEFSFTDFHIRKIPDMTIKQKALVSSNYFEPAPETIFSTPASENGLQDTAFYVEGEVVSRSDVGGYDTIQLKAESGMIYISSVSVPLPEISEGEHITAFFVYMGWSDSLEGACGSYVYSE